MRGTLSVLIKFFVYLRITPAHAGNTDVRGDIKDLM